MPLRLDNARALPTCPQQSNSRRRRPSSRDSRLTPRLHRCQKPSSQNASRPGRHQIGMVGEIISESWARSNRYTRARSSESAGNERLWENVIDANTGSVTEKEVSSSLRELDRDHLGNIIALKSVGQELSDAVRIAEKATEGSALAGGLINQDGKLNFVVVIASGDRLKEVTLEPPRVGKQGATPR